MDVELIGRIEAVAKFTLQLAAELEMRGLIDGPAFSARLRGRPRMQDQLEYVRIARTWIEDMADMLDAAREARALAAQR